MVAFGEVNEQHDYIAVVGTGASLKNVKLYFKDHVKVIAVNQAVKILDHFDYWFTLDTSTTNRLLMKNQLHGAIYYAAVPLDYGKNNARVAAMRREPETNIKYLRRISGTMFGRLRAKSSMPTSPGKIHTGNSGWGAFQLAYHMYPKKIALFGLDGFGNYAYPGGKPTHLQPMKQLFASSCYQIEKRNIHVINGSPDSLIDCYERISPIKAMDWINS